MEARLQSTVDNQLKLVREFVGNIYNIGKTRIKEEELSYTRPLKSGSIPSGNFRVTIADVEMR